MGLFNFGCFVLVEGLFMDNGAFQVDRLSMPPAAPRSHQDSIFSIDFFSGKPNQGIADLNCKETLRSFV